MSATAGKRCDHMESSWHLSPTDKVWRCTGCKEPVPEETIKKVFEQQMHRLPTEVVQMRAVVESARKVREWIVKAGLGTADAPVHPVFAELSDRLDDLDGKERPPAKGLCECEGNPYVPGTTGLRKESFGGHSYAPDGTSDCAHGCGCWCGPTRSGGPDGVDPMGACPKNPLSGNEP